MPELMKHSRRRSRSPRSRSIGELREHGYNLVFLICMFTLLSVALTAALPRFEHWVQREKEAELIFRGMQIAEGIRIFQMRHGRYPNSLQEMLEVEPRSLRQLWRDPMSDDGSWGLILASSGGGESGQAVDEDGNPVDADQNQGRNLAAGSAPSQGFQLDRPSFGTPNLTGPILGVVSRSKRQSIRTFLDKDVYSEWRFTATMLPQPALIPGATQVASASVENFGRPFPPGVKPQAGTGLGGEAAELSGGSAPTNLFDRDGGEDGG